jgi:hypothetical protein
VLKFPVLRLWGIVYASESDTVDCAEPSKRRRCRQQFQTPWQADLETVIIDLMSGQYSNPVRVVTFNTAEHWAEDVSQDVALEIQRRLDLAGDELPSSLAAFVDSHVGPDRQLTLRLAWANVVGSTVSRSDHRAGSKALGTAPEINIDVNGSP